jgi:iron complex transport system ATP-binding protein
LRLFDGFEAGPTKEILTRERLEALYGAPVQLIADTAGTAFVPG